MLKRRASKFTATVAMVAAMLTAGGAANAVGTAPASPTATASVNAPSADASTTATGDYYYVCQYPNGTSLTLTDGSIGSCQGASYVQEYLDGRLLQSLNVTAAGTPATASILCVVAITSSVTSAVYSVGAGAFALVRIAAADAANLNPCD